MKYIQIKSVFVIALFMLLFSTGCNKILDEQPRSIYEPGFFKTEKGVLGGITSQYAHLRFIFGQPYYYNTLEQLFLISILPAELLRMLPQLVFRHR